MAAPAVTRICSIFYGTFEVGGSTRYHLHEWPRIERAAGNGVARAAMGFSIIVQEQTDDDFQASCEAVETAFQQRNVRLRMVMTGTTTETWPDFDPATGTGFNSSAVCSVAGTPGADTRHSRRYDVTIAIELPSPDATGLLDLAVVVEHDTSYMRTVTIRGIYRAGNSGDTATEMYDAGIEALCASITAGISDTATFERWSNVTERDRTDSSLTFTRVYRELKKNQTIAELDSTAIVQHVIGIQRLQPQPGDSGTGIRRLEEFSIRFSCAVNVNVTTNLSALYVGTIRLYMKNLFVSQWSPRQFGIVTELVDYDPVNNRITAEMRILAAVDPSDVIESAMTQRIVENSGMIKTGVWGEGIFSAHVDQGFGSRKRFAIRVVRILGAASPRKRVGGEEGSFWGVSFGNGAVGTDNGGGGGGGPPGPQGINAGLQPSGGSGLVEDGWNIIDNDSATTSKTFGQPGEDQVTVTDLVEQVVEDWVVKPQGGGGGGGGLSIGLTPGPGGSTGGAGIQGA